MFKFHDKNELISKQYKSGRTRVKYRRTLAIRKIKRLYRVQTN